MKLSFIPGQSHYGAARRKKIDTPSLTGRRMATFVAI
jgi:hypothetical protein